MISIFNGVSWDFDDVDGQDSQETELFVKIGIKFLNHLHRFSNSSLKVFLALVFHMDEQRWCYPGRTRLKDILQLNKDTLSQALNELEEAKINNRPVILRVNAFYQNGRVATNHYRVYPTLEQVEYYRDKILIVNEYDKVLFVQVANKNKALEICEDGEPGLSSDLVVSDTKKREPKEPKVSLKSSPLELEHIADEKQVIMLPRPIKNQGIPERYRFVLGKLDEAADQNKSVVCYDGTKLTYQTFFSTLVKELYGEDWVDFGRIGQLLGKKPHKNRWLFLETALSGVGKINGNPYNWITNGITARLKKEKGENNESITRLVSSVELGEDEIDSMTVDQLRRRLPTWKTKLRVTKEEGATEYGTEAELQAKVNRIEKLISEKYSAVPA